MSTPCAFDPERWFRTDAESIFAAKTICSTCPVRKACDDLAEHLQPTAGIWAGLTPEERGVGMRPKRAPGSSKRAIVDCAECGRTAPNAGRGMCATCYRRAWRAINISGTRVYRQISPDLVDRARSMRRQGLPWREIALLLGISKTGIEKAVERANKREDAA